MKYDILKTLFKNGGRADWEMLEDCHYDFEDVWNKMLQFVDVYNMDFNDILIGCVDVYKSNMQEKIDNLILETRKEMTLFDEDSKEWYNDSLIVHELEDILNPDLDIEVNANYLCTSIRIPDPDIRDLYREYLSKEVEEENNKIGFVYLDFEEEL